MYENSTTGHCSPYRGKIFSVTEGAPGDGTHPRSSRRRHGHMWLYYVFFVKIWVKDPVFDNL